MIATFRAMTLASLSLAVLVSACGGEPEPEPASDAPAAAPAPAPGPSIGPAAGAEGGLLDPNAASIDQLLDVPHVDQALADALVAGRPYQDMLAVDAVLAGSLSEEQREEVYGQLWKRIDLNAASGEEILLIPGIGERMEHEFEEYRPYRAIEEFRREMGKYVDEAEVARLERYVEVR
jgi:DNA uptake protein ComE-like DNA-binding protein